MDEINQIENKLKDKNCKLTSQRKAIIEVLLENKDQFLTAEDIFMKAKAKIPSTNFSTVYRNLDLLQKCGIISKNNIKGGVTSAYEIVTESAHHHLMICKDCGKTQPIDFCPFEEISKKLCGKNFKLTDHKFELYGYCEECNKKHS